MASAVSDPSPIPNLQSVKLRDIPVEQRAAALNLSDSDLAALRNGLSLDQANHMIENVVATFALPMGIAQNFVVNGREVLVPMVVEEASVVAACSYAAKLAKATGGFVAGSSEPIMIGQIQVLDVPDMDSAIHRIEQAKDELIHWLNTQNPSTQSKHARAVGMEIRDWGLEIGAMFNPNHPSPILSLPCSSFTFSTTAAMQWARTSSTPPARPWPPRLSN